MMCGLRLRFLVLLAVVLQLLVNPVEAHSSNSRHDASSFFGIPINDDRPGHNNRKNSGGSSSKWKSSKHYDRESASERKMLGSLHRRQQEQKTLEALQHLTPSPPILKRVVRMWDRAFSWNTTYEDGTLSTVWGITSMFNVEPRTELAYRAWYESVRKQGLQILLVHAFREGNAPSVYLNAQIVINHRVGENTLVSKEMLLNVALDNLPKSCTKVIWIDADTVMSNEAWVHQTAHALDVHPIVQPFSFFVRLPPGITSIDDQTSTYMLDDAFMPGGVYHSVPLGLTYHGHNITTFFVIKRLGHTGGVWAARRSIMNELRFFEGFVLGGGDYAMVGAMCGAPGGTIRLLGALNGLPILATWEKYNLYIQKAFGFFGCNIGVVPGIAGHIWHGPLGSRKYSNRYEALINLHLEIFQGTNSSSPVWELAMNNSIFAQQVYPLISKHHAGKYLGPMDLASFWGPIRRYCVWVHQMWLSYQHRWGVAHGTIGNKVGDSLSSETQEDTSTSAGGGIGAGSTQITTSNSPVTTAPDVKVRSDSTQFCGLTAYFNVLRSPTVLNRYHRFRETTKRQGLYLITVELVFDNHYPQTQHHTDLHLVVRKSSEDALRDMVETPSAAWFHKEYLLNVGLQKLPGNCEYVCWLDNDITFTNEDWISQTIETLQSGYRLVQPFAMSVQLPCGVDWLDPTTMNLWNDAYDKPVMMQHSVAFGLSVRPVKTHRIDHSVCSDHFVRGHPGLAWATHASLLHNHGLFDFVVGAGADTMMVLSSLAPLCTNTSAVGTEPLFASFPSSVMEQWTARGLNWSQTFPPSSIGHVSGLILRPWLGSWAREQINLGVASSGEIRAVINAQRSSLMGAPKSVNSNQISRNVRRLFSIPEDANTRCPPWKPCYCRFQCGYRKWLWDEYRLRQLIARARKTDPNPGLSIPIPSAVASPPVPSMDAPPGNDTNTYDESTPFLLRIKDDGPPQCLSFLAAGGSRNFTRLQYLYTKRCSQKFVSGDMLWVMQGEQFVSAFWSSNTLLLKRCLTVYNATWPLHEWPAYPVVLPCLHDDVEHTRWQFDETTNTLQVTIEGHLLYLCGTVGERSRLSLTNSSSEATQWVREFLDAA